MAKNQLRFMERFGQEGGQGAWRTVTFVEVASAVLLVTWFYAQGIPPFLAGTWLQALSLFAIHLGLTLAVERILSFNPIGYAWRQRLAFLASACGPVCVVVLQFLLPGKQMIHFWGFLAALAGAFAGGMLATGLDSGLWENNSPPSKNIQAEVQRKHQEILGNSLQERTGQYLMYRILALLGLVFFAPVAILCCFLIWVEDPGPVLFVKNSVGRGGVNFRQYKFRTMVHWAENGTGPVMAREEDPRVLLCGRFLRKTALDELPQLINILCGEMSFVGPRPQRTVLVYGYLENIPEYAYRHAVLPGLSGLAQVAGDYYLTPRQKLRFDRLYIRYGSLGFDLKLLLLACSITFWFRWQAGWNGRLPRALLHG